MPALLSDRHRPAPTSRPRWRGVPLLASVVVITALLGACSDEPRRVTAALSSDPRPAQAPGTTSTELPPRDDGSDEAPSTTEPPGGGDEDVDELCRSMREFAESGATDDPDALVRELEEWRALAPKDLRDDLDLIIGMVDTLRSIDSTDPSAIGEVFDTLTDPELADAITELGRFATEECSVQLDPGLGLPG